MSSFRDPLTNGAESVQALCAAGGPPVVDDSSELAALHHAWLRALLARLHHGAIVHERTPSGVRDIYDQVCADHTALRTVLDANAANPVLWEATSAEFAMLARIAGLTDEAMSVDEAAERGRGLVSARFPVQRSGY